MKIAAFDIGGTALKMGVVADSGELVDPEPAVAGVELLGVEPPGVAPPGVEPPGVAPPGVKSDGVGVGPVGVGVGSLGFGVGVDPGALSRRRARTAAASTPCSATRPPTRSVSEARQRRDRLSRGPARQGGGEQTGVDERRDRPL